MGPCGDSGPAPLSSHTLPVSVLSLGRRQFSALPAVEEFCFYWCRLLSPRGSFLLLGAVGLCLAVERDGFCFYPYPSGPGSKRPCCPSLSGLRLLLQYRRVVGERGRVSICPPCLCSGEGLSHLFCSLFFAGALMKTYKYVQTLPVSGAPRYSTLIYQPTPALYEFLKILADFFLRASHALSNMKQFLGLLCPWKGLSLFGIQLPWLLCDHSSLMSRRKLTIL